MNVGYVPEATFIRNVCSAAYKCRIKTKRLDTAKQYNYVFMTGRNILALISLHFNRSYYIEIFTWNDGNMRKKIAAFVFFMVSTGCNADAAGIASQMQSSADFTSRSVTSSVASEHSKQNTKLMLQLKIDALRARLGGVSDIEVKKQLEKELKQLQQQRQSI